VLAGEPLPPLGLSHHGVGIVQGFDDAAWIRLRAPLEGVAQKAPAGTPAYVVEIAERLLATRESMLLPNEALQKMACALLDPTVPPMTPALFESALEELGLAFDALETALRRRAPRCHALVRPQLDAFRSIR
jgi:hypothetical protein